MHVCSLFSRAAEQYRQKQCPLYLLDCPEFHTEVGISHPSLSFSPPEFKIALEVYVCIRSLLYVATYNHNHYPSVWLLITFVHWLTNNPQVFMHS